MAKMFVHYNGTVDNFKKIENYAELYKNSIVFISGVNDQGAAIFTHGKFYANIKDIQNLATQLSELRIIKGIKVGEDTKIAADHNGIIEFTSDNNSTVSIVDTPTGIKIGLNGAFVKQVTDNTAAIAKEVEDRTEAINSVNQTISGVSNRVKTIEDDYLKASDKEEILGSITASGGNLLGSATDASSANTIYGAKKYAEEKASAAEEAAKNAASADATNKANTAEQNAKDYADGLKNTIDTAYAAADAVALQAAKDYADGLADNYDEAGSASSAAASALAEAKSYADQAELDAIATAGTNADSKIATAISGLDADKSGESSDKHVKVQVVEVDGKLTEVVVTTDDIASAAVLAQVKSDVDYFLGDALNKENAEAVKDTLKEIQDYIDSDVQGAAAMTASIKANETAAANAQAAADKAQGEVDALEGVVETFKGTYNDKVAELVKADSDNLETAKSDATSKANKALEDAKAYADQAEADAVTEAGKNADSKIAVAIANLDVEDTAVSGKYVSAVSEVDGKISVTRENLPTYTLSTGSANGTVALNGVDAAVKGLGSAAYTEAGAYATAAQGATADKAAQDIAAMDLAEVSGYITKVSQADGKVSATAVQAIPAAHISVADADNLITATDAEGALKELKSDVNALNKTLSDEVARLEAMWVWEEL